MSTTKRILGLAFLVCLLGSPLCGPRTYAQQNNAAATANQEFIDSIKKGDLAKVREMLKQDPELIHAYSPDGWTPLHLNFGNVEIARLLIDSGADINSVSKNKFTATPLQGAVVNKSIEVGRLLLARGANVNPRNDDGGNPLHEAAGDGQIEFAKLLRDKGAVQ